MVLHKLHIEEFDEVDYELIAIHSLLEDYRLAYAINKIFPVLLTKNKEELVVFAKEGEVMFSKFTFDAITNDVKWSLIQNKNEIITKKKSTVTDLFLDTHIEIETKVFLLPELKKVDYFLKIENNSNDFDVEEIVKKINNLEKITAVYTIVPEKIKSKNNLIF